MTKNKEKSLHGCKVVFVTLILVMLSLSALAGTESEIDNNQVLTVAYSFDVPYVEKLSIDDNVYDKVVLPGVPSIADPGEPCLPVKGAYILIPKNTQVSKIDVTSSEKVYLGSDFNIEPFGKPVPLSMANLAKYPEPDPRIYDSNDLFPGVLFTEIGTYSFRGYDVLVLSLYPVQYIPIKGELFYFNNITVSVELVKDNNANTLFRGLMNDKLEITKKVDNPTVVDTYKKSTTCPVLEQYDFLILTIDDFKQNFKSLKDAHDAEGIKTEIKTLGDISLFPDHVTPEDIRSFIRDEYLNHGIEYLLIGGDADIVPDKMLYVFGFDEDNHNRPYETEMPVDMYYGCLDGPYNSDGDDRWGEPDDGENGGDVDLIAEIYVGRACVDNIFEIDNFVTKTISYMNTDFDEEYLKEIWMVGEYLGDHGVASWGGNYLDLLIDESDLDGYTTVGIPSNKYNIGTLYDRDLPEHWSSEDIITIVNKGIHILNHDGHSYYGYNMRMVNNKVESFTNDQYFFAYSIGCMAGGFDDPDGYDCFAEYMTVKTENGAFAGIWNARYGWFWAHRTDGDGTRYTREFWDAVFGENIPVISKANQDSREDNLYLIQRSCMRWTYYQLNLFGDPAIAFHISNPPNKPSMPSGPTSGSAGIECTYASSTIDPDGDQVFYLWDFGDGTNSGWLGPYVSGVTSSINYSWEEKGNYVIKVKAKDGYGAESEWSDPLPVSMPKNKLLSIDSLFLRLLERFLGRFPLLGRLLPSTFGIILTF